MAKFFYADCVITDISIDNTTESQLIVTAKVDGREFKKLSMTAEMCRYFNGIGKGTKNRIWFYKYGLIGITFIAAVENEAGERLERFTPSIGMKFYDLLIRPAAAGFLFWFAAWVLLFIPVVMYAYKYHANDWKGPFEWLYNFINPIGVYGGIAFAIWVSYKSLDLYKKLANLDSWSGGDLSRYTKAVKPAFGEGLAALKK